MGLQGYDHMLEKVKEAQREISHITAEMNKVQGEIRRLDEERRRKLSEYDSLKKKLKKEYELLQALKGGTRHFLRQLRFAFAKR